MAGSLRWAAAPLAVTLVVLVGATQVLADGDCHPYGNTERVNHGPEKGAIQLTSDTSQAVAYGGIDVTVPKGMTFADLTRLSSDYAMTEGVCVGGSPRFQINVLPPGDTNANDTKNIFVYFGSIPTSGVNACPEAVKDEVNTGNYIGTGGPGDVPGRYDTSQIGGTQVSIYTATLVQFGNWQVTGIQVVDDSGWAAGTQQVLIDRLQVNDDTCYPDHHQDKL